MTFDSNEVELKMQEIENVIAKHYEVTNKMRDIHVKLNSIVDKTDYERNDDGSIKYDENGQMITKIIKTVDQFTGEILSDERKNQIKNALFAKFDEINQSS